MVNYLVSVDSETKELPDAVKYALPFNPRSIVDARVDTDPASPTYRNVWLIQDDGAEIDLGDFRGLPGADGSNVLPTNTAIAAALSGSGAARDALNSVLLTTYMTLETKRLVFQTGQPIVLSFAGVRRPISLRGYRWLEYMGTATSGRQRNNEYVDTGLGGYLPRPFLTDQGQYYLDRTATFIGQATPATNGTATITLGSTTTVGMRTIEVTDGIESFKFDIAVIGPKPAAVAGKTSAFGVGLQLREDLTEVIGGFADLGVGLARHEVAWTAVETVKGTYSMPSWQTARLAALTAAGVETLALGTYQNPLYANVDTVDGAAGFAKYFEYVLNNTPGVKYAELFNEWELNAPTGSKTGTAYATFCQRVYSYLKPKFPSITFIGGFAQPRSDQPVWTDFIAAGGLAYLDGVSLHYYQATTFDMKSLLQTWETKRIAAGKDALKYLVTEWNTYQAAGVPSPDHRTQYRNGWGLNAHLIATYASEVPLDAFTFYVSVDDGNIPGSREGHFGLFQAKTTRVRGYQPKSTVVSAWMLRDLLGKYPTYVESFSSGTIRHNVFQDSAGKKLHLIQRVGTINTWVEDLAPYRAGYSFILPAGTYSARDLDQPGAGDSGYTSTGTAKSWLVGQNVLAIMQT